MPKDHEGRRPSWDLVHRQNTADTGQNDSFGELNHFDNAFWNTLIEKSAVCPPGEDPAYWPLRILNEFQYLTSDHRQHIIDQKRRLLGENLIPMAETIRNVRTAYQILAYPKMTNPEHRKLIEGDLKFDQNTHARNRVELSTLELEILRRLCEGPRYAAAAPDIYTLQPKIPFNSDKRVYSYSEVLKEGRKTWRSAVRNFFRGYRSHS